MSAGKLALVAAIVAFVALGATLVIELLPFIQRAATVGLVR